MKIGSLAHGRRAAALALAIAAFASPALAETESAPVVTARSRATLVAEMGAIVPGTAVPIALRLILKPGWHTYWRNPGDSGEPAVVTLRIDGNEIKGPDRWPTPERIDIAGIISYGHHGDVVLVTTVAPPAAAQPGGAVRIEAEATWLVCEKVCVPERGNFTLSLPVAAGSAPGSVSEARSPNPQPLPAVSGLFAKTEQGWNLRVPVAALDAADGQMVEAYFFPERGDLIDHSAPQIMRGSEGEIALILMAAQLPVTPPSELRGVLAVTRQSPDGARRTRHFQLAARPPAEAR